MTSVKAETKSNSSARKKEWLCRILLTINVILVLNGLVSFIQADYQLISPLIPQSTVYLITRIDILSSAWSGLFLIISLWFYFYKKYTVVIILGIFAIIIYLIKFELFF
jgi:hypothetical protein